MPSFRLPVSGLRVAMRTPSGAEDLLLAEEPSRDLSVAMVLLSRITEREEGGAIEWASLPLTDTDFAVLKLRQLVVGDHVRTAIRCAEPSCCALFDISFKVSDYLGAHLGRKARNVLSGDEPGWFRLRDTEVFFRAPTPRDLVELAGADAARALPERCIRGPVAAAVKRRIESALQAMAPSLFGELSCACNECGAGVTTIFNPVAYVLEELAQRATTIYEEIHLLAVSYHWSEEAILALPRPRRARYAEFAYDARRGA